MSPWHRLSLTAVAPVDLIIFLQWKFPPHAPHAVSMAFTLHLFLKIDGKISELQGLSFLLSRIFFTLNLRALSGTHSAAGFCFLVLVG